MIALPSRNDIPFIADLHILSLPNELLSKLGRKFLTEVYSEGIKNNDSFFIISKSGKKIHGFIFLTKNSGAFYKKLILSRFLKLILIVTQELIRDITLFKKLISTGKHLLLSDSESTPEILVFAVDPSMQRGGIGSSLLQALEDKLALANISVYNVKTTSSNEKSNSFYKKNGFKVIKRFNIQQREWVEYKKKL